MITTTSADKKQRKLRNRIRGSLRQMKRAHSYKPARQLRVRGPGRAMPPTRVATPQYLVRRSRSRVAFEATHAATIFDLLECVARRAPKRARRESRALPLRRRNACRSSTRQDDTLTPEGAAYLTAMWFSTTRARTLVITRRQLLVVWFRTTRVRMLVVARQERHALVYALAGHYGEHLLTCCIGVPRATYAHAASLWQSKQARHEQERRRQRGSRMSPGRMCLRNPG